MSPSSRVERVIVTDCGSTTTKALLFEKTAQGWRQVGRGEAPTTVEAPLADVTVGARNAFLELATNAPYEFLNFDASGEVKRDGPLRYRGDGDDGIDLYLSTSSAGGGLQMVVAGLVGTMSASSAARAALGAGAIVMDIFAADDERDDLTLMRRLRHLRPDILLIAGGTDGGASHYAIEIAELVLNAAPRPRFGNTLRLPVIFAGNSVVAAEVDRILSPIAQVATVANVRPTLEAENLAPARDGIHEFFLSHVMSHSPGYDQLLTWTSQDVVPTPAAVAHLIEIYGRRTGASVLCVDIGGATTDVFSFRVKAGIESLHRTVSANLGMSYSIANVLKESGTEAILRWLPFPVDRGDLRDELRNKMVRPTSLPHTVADLCIEQAVCREALRLSLEHHLSLASGLSGVKRQRSIADVFSQGRGGEEFLVRDLDLVIGSGGVLSHAPDRRQAALMMLEGFALEGVSELAVDSIFMMPHLGIFALHDAQAAWEIFEHDCLVRLGLSIVPVYPLKLKEGTPIARVNVDGVEVAMLHVGEFRCLDEYREEPFSVRVEPLRSTVDVGLGVGVTLERQCRSGVIGVLLDGRNRPMHPRYFTPQARAELYNLLGLKRPDADELRRL